jgi:hypothetical protein
MMDPNCGHFFPDKSRVLRDAGAMTAEADSAPAPSANVRALR